MGIRYAAEIMYIFYHSIEDMLVVASKEIITNVFYNVWKLTLFNTKYRNKYVTESVSTKRIWRDNLGTIWSRFVSCRDGHENTCFLVFNATQF